MRTGLQGSLSRMSPRERNLVVTLVSLVLLLVIGGGIYYVRGLLKEKEEKIKRNRQAWAQIQKLSGPYLATRQQRADLLADIRKNPDALSPDGPIAETAVQTQVRYRTGVGSEDESAPLNKILMATGDLLMRPVYQRRRRQKGPQIYRVEKQFQMQRGFARTDDIFTFLGEVEALDSMVFVSKLHLTRWSRDPDYVQIKNLTASTLRWVETTEEE